MSIRNATLAMAVVSVAGGLLLLDLDRERDRAGSANTARGPIANPQSAWASTGAPEDGAVAGLVRPESEESRISASSAATPNRAATETAEDPELDELEGANEMWIDVRPIDPLILEQMARDREAVIEATRRHSTTLTPSELEEWRTTLHREHRRNRSAILNQLAETGVGDTYRVMERNEDGSPVPPRSDQMPEGTGEMITGWTTTEDPNIIRIMILDYGQYRGLYENEWTSNCLHGYYD